MGVAYNHTIKLVTLIMTACFGIKRVSVGKGLFPLRRDAAVATAGVFIRQTDWLTHLTSQTKDPDTVTGGGVFFLFYFKLLYTVIVTKKIAEMTATSKIYFPIFIRRHPSCCFSPHSSLLKIWSYIESNPRFRVYFIAAFYRNMLNWIGYITLSVAVSCNWDFDYTGVLK